MPRDTNSDLGLGCAGGSSPSASSPRRTRRHTLYTAPAAAVPTIPWAAGSNSHSTTGAQPEAPRPTPPWTTLAWPICSSASRTPRAQLALDKGSGYLIRGRVRPLLLRDEKCEGWSQRKPRSGILQIPVNVPWKSGHSEEEMYFPPWLRAYRASLPLLPASARWPPSCAMRSCPRRESART